MLFTSFSFTLFLVVTFVLYYTIPKAYQWKLLLLASFIFYALSGVSNLIYIGLTIVSTYAIGRKISSIHDRQEEYLKQNKETLSKEEKKSYKATVKSERWKYLLLCLFINFGILGVVKYTDFFIGNVNSVLDFFGKTGELQLLNFLLPLGISFYTFKTMSYIIDVYRGKYKAEPNVFKFALFTSFFPQIIQGPISRFDDLNETLCTPHNFETKTFSYGVQRIIWGVFKKLVIADRLLIATRELVSNPAEYQGIYVLLAMFFYAVTLYADFTGGIDITIGISEALGIKVKENFNHPFYSKSIMEYWRRWHITMGAWFREYLFYPLSVCRPMLKLATLSRKYCGDYIGKRATVYLCTLVVWFSTGFWHGASWNFIVWGLANGVFIILSQEFEPLFNKFGKLKFTQTFAWGCVQIFKTFWLMCFIRSFDCYASVKTTVTAHLSILTNFSFDQFIAEGVTNLGLSTLDYAVLIFAICLTFVVSYLQHHGDNICGARDYLAKLPSLVRYSIITALVLFIIVFGVYGIGYDSSQFIYNQF